MCITTAHHALIWALLERNNSYTVIKEQHTHLLLQLTYTRHWIKICVYMSFVHYGTIWNNLKYCCAVRKNICIAVSQCVHHARTHSSTHTYTACMSNLNRTLTNTMFLKLHLHYNSCTWMNEWMFARIYSSTNWLMWERNFINLINNLIYQFINPI